MKRVDKPNSVTAYRSGGHSSGPCVTAWLEQPTRKRRLLRHRTGRPIAFPYLALHREEFAWPRLLPTAPVGSYPTVSPITRCRAGLFSVALVVTPCEVPGRYPARRPVVFGLSSVLSNSDRPTRFTARLGNYSKDC